MNYNFKFDVEFKSTKNSVEINNPHAVLLLPGAFIRSLQDSDLRSWLGETQAFSPLDNF